MIIVLYIVGGLLLVFIGMIIGYDVCKRDQEKTKAKVMNMSDHELFMRRHGLKN